MCYRQEFEQQFLWAAQQAVEKYLKAILVFNHRSAKGLSHNILKSYRRVAGIDYLDFKVPERSEDFLEYLDEHGSNRYLTKPSIVRENALDELDETVWHIRKFCISIMNRVPDTDPTEYQPFLARLKSSVHPSYVANPIRHRLPDNGYLEKIMRESLPQADLLVWRNLFYGRRRKNKRGFYSGRIASVARPTHFVWPDTIDLVGQYIDLPRKKRSEVRKG